MTEDQLLQQLADTFREVFDDAALASVPHLIELLRPRLATARVAADA